MFQKIKIPLFTILGVLFIDQFIKIYIKANYPLGEVGRVGDWCILHFTENPGMAFGLEFGGSYGKLILSIFRIMACIGGFYYIRHLIQKKEHAGFIFSVSLVLAGAIGNILDSAFYGMIFDKGTTFNLDIHEYEPYSGVANFTRGGYAPAMYGCVVDMFYFPLIEGHFPSWFPIWGGEEFQFFRPIFNFADFSISFGVGILLAFHKRFAKSKAPELALEQTNTQTPPSSENNLNTPAN